MSNGPISKYGWPDVNLWELQMSEFPDFSDEAFNMESAVYGSPWPMTSKWTWGYPPKATLREDVWDQPGQVHDRTRERKSPSYAVDTKEGRDEDDEEGNEEREGELDDNGKRVSQEQKAEIKPGPQRKRREDWRRRGNNPYGSRGCESCMPCRRRKFKCVYKDKADRCESCARKNQFCGPKFTKAEYFAIQNGEASPDLRLSEITRELELEMPGTDRRELYVILGQRLNEIEQKKNDAASLRSRASAHPRGHETKHRKARKGG